MWQTAGTFYIQKKKQIKKSFNPWLLDNEESTDVLCPSLNEGVDNKRVWETERWWGGSRVTCLCDTLSVYSGTWGMQ